MAMGEADLGLGPDLLPSIIKVILVYHQVFIAMVITEVEMDLRPFNFMHITMVD